jgi:steroid delta-isomerase-like uncharacterized protein
MSQNQAASRLSANPMSVEANRAMMRRWIEDGWNKHNVGLIDEIFATDVFEHDPGGLTVDGAEALKAHINGFLTALPDIRFTIEDLIAEGDVVVCRFDSTATHTGTLMNIPATGKTARVSGMLEFRFADGKVAEVWAMHDLFGMLRQIGVIPDPA